MTRMRCRLCGVDFELEVRDGDGVWTAFCTPAHCKIWQHPRSEREIIEQTSGFGLPYDRCQWCGSTLKSGYHEDGCPCRDQRVVEATADDADAFCKHCGHAPADAFNCGRCEYLAVRPPNPGQGEGSHGMAPLG